MKKGLSPLLWLFLALFFIRAFIPAGFMPDMSGKNIMTICSGMGMSTVIVDDNNQPVDEKTHPTLTDVCPFSFLSTALLTNSDADLNLVAAPEIISEGMTAFLLAGILPVSLQNNHLSRAPPQFF